MEVFFVSGELSAPLFRTHMSQAADIEEGKLGTALFVFLKHYLCWMFPLVVVLE